MCAKRVSSESVTDTDNSAIPSPGDQHLTSSHAERYVRNNTGNIFLSCWILWNEARPAIHQIYRSYHRSFR